MKDSNTKLAEWLGRSGWSRGELARRVRSLAAEWGQPHISSDASSVRRWLHGEVPRPPVPAILADLFSARFGYRVTTYDLGLGDAPDIDRALFYSPSWAVTVESVAELGRADVERRAFLAGAPFAVAAAVGPSRDWLLNTLDGTPRPGRRVRLEDVTAVRNMFGAFQEMDIFQGGGSGRLALAAYMNEHVYPLLRRTHTDDVRRALCEAAAEQTYLLGWMAFDNGEHGTAQRYLTQALRLAEESKDAALGAHVLAGMADQATLLGHPAEGRRLAQAGRQGLARTHAPACLADLWTLEARALAALGEEKATAHAVNEAERVFATVVPEREPEWAKFIDPAYLGGEWAHAFRDLGRPEHAEEHARRSIGHARRQNRARRGAMSQATLAVSHLQRRDLESAHAAGVRAVDLAGRVKSSRCVEAVRGVQRRMVPFGRHPLVADFNERAAHLRAA
ncbi:transcriptional regulator [Streptomyces sp. AV19]|uniref:transcriptional regulator n=1 Tax=Streptomyces sp. AV19 TaxID=2793068 RepID=UPI0018FE3BF1|nr:transcriptional regulator [Streptomyces sp. AV19]MBH1935254.1 transcriptional regulator [Streptomyces sp. AV19]MDG4532070.1 transcriptional regulator [Streptomyces sp. AV19]